MTIERKNGKLVERQSGEYGWFKINEKSSYKLNYVIYIDEEINKTNKLGILYSTSYERTLKEIKALKNKGHKILLKKSYNRKGIIYDMYYNIH